MTCGGDITWLWRSGNVTDAAGNVAGNVRAGDGGGGAHFREQLRAGPPFLPLLLPTFCACEPLRNCAPFVTLRDQAHVTYHACVFCGGGDNVHAAQRMTCNLC
eukprot:2832527-Rhodomonas_salina.2